MAGQIKMQPEVMRNRAKETDGQVEAMQNLIKAMDKLLQTLKGEWEGDAMAGYEERYSKIKPSLSNAEALLQEIAHNLRATAQILEETDKNIASQFRK